MIHAFQKKSPQTPKKLGISPARGVEAVIKAQLIAAVIKEVQKQDLTHAELAKKASGFTFRFRGSTGNLFNYCQ